MPIPPWGSPPPAAGGGSGTVTNVSSADTSIVVTTPTTTPVLKVATLDVVATNEPPAADWSNNSHKITSLANGSAATDAAAIGQVLLLTTYDPAAISQQVLGTTATQTITNKRFEKRTGTVASSATPTINTDNIDFFSVTALAVAITSMTTNLTGTPVEAQTLWLAFTDNGTARAITWGASFEASTVALPLTTVASTRLDVGLVWNTATSKWRCVATA